MTLSGAYIVKLKDGAIAGIPRKACAGRPTRLGYKPSEGEVCGKAARYGVGGLWLCGGCHSRMLTDAAVQEAAGRVEATVVPLGTCVFPWCSPRAGTVQLCGEPAVESVAGAGACERHFEEATRWLWARDKAIRDEERHRAADLFEAEMRTWAAVGQQVVYYLRRVSDGAIKIGTSTQFRRRHYKLSQEHGNLEILATHCGDRDRERKMHEKFDALAIGGEWFTPGIELLEWILHVRRAPANLRTRLPDTVPPRFIMALLKQAREEAA